MIGLQVVRLLETCSSQQYFASTEWLAIREDFKEEAGGGTLGRLPSTAIDEDEEETEEICEHESAGCRKKQTKEEGSSRTTAGWKRLDIDGLPLLEGSDAGGAPEKDSPLPERLLLEQSEDLAPR